MDDKIDILMASYNGSKFIQQQIESILNQTYQNFTLIIGDDYSTDNTPLIVKELQKKNPEKIVFFEFKENVGLRENFSRLLDYVEADYIMFSDQDDVWLPHKIEISMAKMKELESTYGPEEPILVATDAIVANDDLKEIHPSYMKYALFNNPDQFTKLNRLLCHGAFMGYSQLFNKSLLNLISPIPPEADTHDYWTSLAAAAVGKIGFINQPTLFYRQHESQYIGAKRLNFIWFIRFLKRENLMSKIETFVMYPSFRAYLIYKHYNEILPDNTKEMLLEIIKLKEGSFFNELKCRFKYHLFTLNFWLNLLILAVSLKMGKMPEKYRFKL